MRWLLRTLLRFVASAALSAIAAWILSRLRGAGRSERSGLTDAGGAPGEGWREPGRETGASTGWTSSGATPSSGFSAEDPAPASGPGAAGESGAMREPSPLDPISESPGTQRARGRRAEPSDEIGRGGPGSGSDA